eukprot:UN25620
MVSLRFYCYLFLLNKNPVLISEFKKYVLINPPLFKYGSDFSNRGFY